jgi:hypothetical protein
LSFLKRQKLTKMNKSYLLKNAFVNKATGLKVNAMASPVNDAELIRHKAYFTFKFFGAKELSIN